MLNEEYEALARGRIAEGEITPGLDADRHRPFLKALEEEQVTAGGWSFYSTSRPTYVRYNARGTVSSSAFTDLRVVVPGSSGCS